ncbi:hypothetical protein Aduo_018666 [Ancylostoma duodenale]
MAHLELPGLKHLLARAEKVNDDMFELVNISSMSEKSAEVFIAVVRGFAKVIVEIDFGDAITIHMYDEWSTLAKELLETQQMMSIIVV